MRQQFAKGRLQTCVCVCSLLVGSLPGMGQGLPSGPKASAGQLLQLGSEALRQGKLPEAERLFTEAATADPRSAEAELGLGLVQLREGHPEPAAAALSKAASLNPHLGGAHLFLGIAEDQTGHSGKAIEDVQTELRLSPDSVEGATWLTIMLLAANRAKEAIPVVDHAVSLSQNDPQLLYLQARVHGIVVESALRGLYKIDPDSALVHRARAESFASGGEAEKAVTEFELAVKKTPESPELYEELGEQDQKLARFDAARVAYKKELELNPKSGVALFNLGKIDVERGEPSAGIELLRQAEAARVDGAPADFYLGLGLAESGHDQEAVQRLEQALTKQPTPFIEQGTLFQLGRVYQRLGRKEDAQRVLAKWQQLKATEASGQPGTAVGDVAPSAGQRTQ